MNRSTVADLYFMDARAKLIDLAAFLDRIDRSEGADDHRLRAFRRALAQLAARSGESAAAADESTAAAPPSSDRALSPAAPAAGHPAPVPRASRAEETLLAFSDPTREPAAVAGGKAATGAWREEVAP